jgi:hypothetical protein
LLAEVARTLRVAGIEHALIGAAALAAHGIARATADLDLLVLDTRCLEPALWAELRSAGCDVQIRVGDADDPLAGVVRVSGAGESTVDVIVGRHAWQRSAIRAASPTRIGEEEVPVVGAPELILLKLHAGGPQGAWDVDQLLDLDDVLRAAVEGMLRALPEDAVALWRRILAQRGAPR